MPINTALARLLSKADITLHDLPLEALICEQHGLKAGLDYPLAPVAASADGLQVGDAYWLRADPAHLVLQRDSFSLGEPFPLQVEELQAQAVIADLNRHFGNDGLVFSIGNSGAWYLRLNQSPLVHTALPAKAMGRNVYQFMPQGEAAAKWVSYLNEIQMLLHDHAANMAREAVGDAAINSIWLSGGGVMPSISSVPNKAELWVCNEPFYIGLANLAGIRVQALHAVADVIQAAGDRASVRMQLPVQQDMDDSFKLLWNALRSRTIEQLTLNLGYYDKTLTAVIRPIDTYRFWRKVKPVIGYLT